MPRVITAGAAAEATARHTTIDILVESEDLDLRYSFETTTAGGHTWEHRLLRDGISDIVYQVEPGGGLASVSTLRLRVIDDGVGNSPSALIASFGKLKGADLILSLLFEGEDYADKIVLYANGIIDSSRRDGIITELIAVDGTFSKDILLPATIVPQDDPDAAKSAIGRALPLLYGDAITVKHAPMLLTNSTGRVYKAAAHAIRTISSATYSIYQPNGNRFKTRTGDATVSTADASLTLDAGLGGLIFGSQTPGPVVAREQAVTASSNAIDGNSTTFADISTSSALDANGEGYGFLGIAATFVEPEGSDILSYTVSQHRGHVAAATTVNSQFRVRITSSAGAIVQDDLDTTQDFRFFTNYRDYNAIVKGIKLEGNQRLEVLVETFNEGGLGSTKDFWRVADVSLTLSAEARGDQDDLYLSFVWQGRPDNGAGTYTGTSGAVIEIPSDVLYSVANIDLGLLIDQPSIVTARAELTNWRMGGGVGAGWFKERATAREFLNDLCIQGKSIFFPADDGLKLVAYRQGINTTAVVTETNTGTILWEAGTQVETPPAQRSSTFRVDQEILAEVANSFEVYYDYNPGARKFDSVRFANKDETNSTQGDAADLVALCNSSFLKYGETRTHTVEAYFIYDNDTAEFLLDHLVRYFSEKRIVAEWESGTSAIRAQLGDPTRIIYPDLPSQASSNNHNYEIHKIRYRFIPVRTSHGVDGLSFRIAMAGSRVLSTSLLST
jgi:hypothetical protein